MEMKKLLEHERASLATLAKAAGADLWTKEAIERHKDSEVAKAPPPSRLYAWRGHIQTVSMVIALTLLCGFVGGLLSSFILIIVAPLNVAGSAFAICLISFGALAILAKVMDITIRAPAGWMINYYPNRSQLPDRALRIMDELTILQPNCKFHLHELKQGTVMLDPILEARYSEEGVSESCYVLVWDKDGNIVSPPAM